MPFKGELDLGNEDPSSKDYFLQNRPMQPKKEIGDYIESQGFLVPQRFKNLDDARTSGKSFMIRSEHPQDYDGASNLLGSYEVPLSMLSSPDEDTSYPFNNIPTIDQDLLERTLVSFSRGSISTYCNFLGLSRTEFESQSSYSYWELLDGYRQAIVADSAIAGRYHVFTASPGMNENGSAYSTIDDGKETMHYTQIPDGKLPSSDGLISLYEKVRNLDNFNPDHCPIMETLAFGDRNYFLQYHRTRDFVPATFKLDRDNGEDEIPAVFVRGVTPETGLKLKVYIHNDMRSRFSVDEEAGVDFYVEEEILEVMSRRRKLQLLRRDSNSSVGFYSNHGHLSRSLLFKPDLSLSLRKEDMDRLLQNPATPPRKERKSANVTINVVSDGETAYLKRVK